MTFDPAGFGFVVNLINETITFDGGYTAKILEMMDTRGGETDEPEKVRFVAFVMPPDGLWITIDLDLLDRDVDEPGLH